MYTVVQDETDLGDEVSVYRADLFIGIVVP